MDTTTFKLQASVPDVLLALDGPVSKALEKGTIRLVSTTYILSLKPGETLKRQQDLLNVKGALISPKQAVGLLAAADRRVLALSYGWLSAGDPDPFGKRLQAVKRALQCLKVQGVLRADSGMFWDFSSLPQKPRTTSEDQAFKDGLGVMANLYASALGTAVLQLKEVPSRPKSEIGSIRVCRMRLGVKDSELRHSYGRFGKITAVESRGDDEATVRFASREAAVKALGFNPKALGMGETAFVCHEYNDRKYNNRGWCVFEDAVSLEFLGRSRQPGHGAMRSAMDGPKCAKVYNISSTSDPVVVEPAGPQARLSVQKALDKAIFTGKGDGKVVLDMYKRFQLDGVQAAARLEAAEKAGVNGQVCEVTTSITARQQLAAENAAKRQQAAREQVASEKIGNHVRAKKAATKAKK